MQGVPRLLVAVLVLLCAGPAHAYVRTRTKAGVPMAWPSTCVPLVLHEGEPPAFLADGELAAAARAAASAWDARQIDCTALEIGLIPKPEASGETGNDGVNRVTFRRTLWCPEPRDPAMPCYDARALAVTTVSARRSDGRILDADLEVNAVNFKWADLVASGPRAGVHDLQNTLTHEMGHLLGFDHTCYTPDPDQPRGTDHTGTPVVLCVDAPPEVKAATLYPEVRAGDTERRSLTDDDRRAACDVYPSTGQACGPTAPVPGGCDCALAPGKGGLRPPAFAVLFLLAAVAGRARRSRPRRPSGRQPT